MSARETAAPREARRCAVAQPMPKAAPVMATVLEDRGLGWLIELWSSRQAIEKVAVLKGMGLD